MDLWQQNEFIVGEGQLGSDGLQSSTCSEDGCGSLETFHLPMTSAFAACSRLQDNTWTQTSNIDLPSTGEADDWDFPLLEDLPRLATLNNPPLNCRVVESGWARPAATTTAKNELAPSEWPPAPDTDDLSQSWAAEQTAACRIELSKASRPLGRTTLHEAEPEPPGLSEADLLVVATPRLSENLQRRQLSKGSRSRRRVASPSQEAAVGVASHGTGPKRPCLGRATRQQRPAVKQHTRQTRQRSSAQLQLGHTTQPASDGMGLAQHAGLPFQIRDVHKSALQPFEIVWARMPSHPWWPAQVRPACRM